MWGRIIAKNSRDMHLGNRKRSKQQKKERAIAKTRDAAFREHAATAEEVCVAVTNSVGIPASQLSQYVDGSLRNNMGELFNSQDGLECAADFVLSLTQEDEE